MDATTTSERPPCPHCAGQHVRRFGRAHGHRRFRCLECRRTWTETFGTPLYRLHTALAEIARSLLIVLRRGSLRAAEEQTGHNYETTGEWLRRAAAHAEALTAVLVHDLHLSEVEVDEFWSFVRHKGGAPRRASPRQRPLTRRLRRTLRTASGGAAWSSTGLPASLSPGSRGHGRRRWRRWWCGPPEADERTAERAGVPWVSDGWEASAETIPAVDRDPIPSGVREDWVILRPTPGVRLTQAIKHHQGRRLERVEVRATLGEAVAQSA